MLQTTRFLLVQNGLADWNTSTYLYICTQDCIYRESQQASGGLGGETDITPPPQTLFWTWQVNYTIIVQKDLRPRGNLGSQRDIVIRFILQWKHKHRSRARASESKFRFQVQGNEKILYAIYMYLYARSVNCSTTSILPGISIHKDLATRSLPSFQTNTCHQ